LRKRKRWLLVTAVVLAVGLSYLVYSLVIHSGADFLTVSELKSQAESLYNQQTRVGGQVAPGSIHWNNKAKVLSFVLTDDSESLNIVYSGIVPDSFKPGADLIIEGKYQPDNIFEATSFGRPRSICNLCH
jgi:cytochrome c-type biogenesis protein CcmE